MLNLDYLHSLVCQTKERVLNAGPPGVYYNIGQKALDLLYGNFITDEERKDRDPVKRFHCRYFDAGSVIPITVQLLVHELEIGYEIYIPDYMASKVKVQHLNNFFGLYVDSNIKERPIINLSGVIGSSALSIGTELSYDTATGNFNKYNAGLGFTSAGGLITSLKLCKNDSGETLNASSYYPISPLTKTATSYDYPISPLTKTAIGAELTYSFSNNRSDLAIGSQHALTSSTLLKARVNTFGKVSALIQQNMLSNLSFTVCAEVNNKEQEHHKKLSYGLSLSYGGLKS